MFLSGAYQEIMGNLHNLFGDTNAVHILDAQRVTRLNTLSGDTMSEVVGYVQYDAEDLVECIRVASKPCKKSASRLQNLSDCCKRTSRVSVVTLICLLEKGKEGRRAKGEGRGWRKNYTYLFPHLPAPPLSFPSP